MKKVSIVMFGIIVSVLLASVCMAAEGSDSAIQQPQTQEKGADKDGIWVESSVSQKQIDTVTKREEAVAQRDEKLKIRARNLQSETVDNDKLFRSSR